MLSQYDFTISYGGIHQERYTNGCLLDQALQYGGSWGVPQRGLTLDNDGIVIVLLGSALVCFDHLCCFFFYSELKTEGASPYLMLIRLRKWTGWMQPW